MPKCVNCDPQEYNEERAAYLNKAFIWAKNHGFEPGDEGSLTPFDVVNIARFLAGDES